jgi:hypothetical protein
MRHPTSPMCWRSTSTERQKMRSAPPPLQGAPDIAALGEDDALSVRYRAMRNAWEHRANANRRDAAARSYEAAKGWADPTLPIAWTVLSRSLIT